MNEWISSKEAAEIIGITMSSVSRLCREKKVYCQQIGTGRRSVWLVDKASAIAYANSEKDKGGRPPKNRVDTVADL